MNTGGSNWWFLKSGKQYSGQWAGTCQYFPDLDGDGRADLHSIMSMFTNQGETFFNRCGLTDAVGDDAGWAPGQDPGFGPLQDPPDDTDSGGKVPALEDKCPDVCWNVLEDKKIKCAYNGTFWDMQDRDDKNKGDQLNIKKLAAIGDSYSAGIGAGNRLGSIFDVLKEGNGKCTFVLVSHGV
jgi:hypothetical protein